jgi:hypothetical protein
VTPVQTGYSVADLPPEFQTDEYELKFRTEETDEDGDPYVYAGAMPRQLIENSKARPTQPYWIGTDRTGQVYSLSLKDRFRHLVITGTTGAGKTTRAVNDVIDHAYRGHGVIVTDPGGEMAYDIIQRLPEDRLNDLVCIDPKADYLDTRVGFNLLETYHTPGEPGFDVEVKAVIDDLLYFLSAQGYEFISRVLSHVFRALIEANDRDDDYTYTLVDARWILGHGGTAGDIDYADFIRERKLNPLLEPYAEELSEVDAEKFDPILRRMDDEILLDEVFRPMFCARDPQLQVADIFDDSLLVVVKCDVHTEMRKQLNRFFTRKMFSVVSSRPLGGEIAVREALGASDPEDRPSFDPFHLVIDEGHSVFTDESAQEVESMFEEFRKRRVGVNLLTQALRQLPGSIQKAVQTNASPIAFNPGGEGGEQRAVANGLTGVDPSQLNINDYHAWVSPLDDDAQPFICELFPMLPPVRDMHAVADAIAASADRYGVVPETAEEVATSSPGRSESNGDADTDASTDTDGESDTIDMDESVRRRAYQAFIDTALVTPGAMDDDEWGLPFEAVSGRLQWYLSDIESPPECSTERLLDYLCEAHLERQPIDGTPHYRVTSAGRDMVFRQSKNDSGTPTDGGEGHHMDVRNLHRVFTGWGWRYEVVRQGGSAGLPDAELCDPAWRTLTDAEHPRRALSHYRQSHPVRYLLTGGARYGLVEPEHATTTNPSQILANLSGALNAGRPCVFVVPEDTDPNHAPTKKAELVVRYVTDDSRYDEAGIDPEAVGPIAQPGGWNVLIRPDHGSNGAWSDSPGDLRCYLGERNVVALNDVTPETVAHLERRTIPD